MDQSHTTVPASTTASAAESPAVSIEKALAGEGLELAVHLATTEEDVIVGAIDAALKNGETNVDNAILAGFKAKIPVIGGTLATALVTSVQGLEPTMEKAAKTFYDRGVAALQALQTKYATS